MQLHTALIFAIIIFFILILYLTNRERQNSIPVLDQTARALSFQPMQEAPPELIEGLHRLQNGREKASPAIDQIYHRQDFNANYYLFNLDDPSDNQRIWITSTTFSVISPSLTSPTFYLLSLPSLDKDGPLNEWMERMLAKTLDWAASHQGFTRLSFPHKYDFDDQYVLFVKDELSAQRFFTDQRLSSLCGIRDHFQIMGGGNLLTISHLYPSPKIKNTSQKELYRILRDVFQLFQQK